MLCVLLSVSQRTLAKPSGKCDYFRWAGTRHHYTILWHPHCHLPCCCLPHLLLPLDWHWSWSNLLDFCRHVEWKTKTDCKCSRKWHLPCGHSMCKRPVQRKMEDAWPKVMSSRDNPQRAIPSHNSGQATDYADKHTTTSKRIFGHFWWFSISARSSDTMYDLETIVGCVSNPLQVTRCHSDYFGPHFNPFQTFFQCFILFSMFPCLYLNLLVHRRTIYAFPIL